MSPGRFLFLRAAGPLAQQPRSSYGKLLLEGPGNAIVRESVQKRSLSNRADHSTEYISRFAMRVSCVFARPVTIRDIFSLLRQQ
jgi:hypothetical protein